MIEKIIIDYLNSALDVPCFAEVPKNELGSYVVIEKTGGKIENHIRKAIIALQSYAPSLFEAAELNERVIESMQNIITLDSVSRAKLNSEYNYTDTARKRYRYQAVYEITY